MKHLKVCIYIIEGQQGHERVKQRPRRLSAVKTLMRKSLTNPNDKSNYSILNVNTKQTYTPKEILFIK